MKSKVKMMLLVCLIVPVVLLMTACGGNAMKFKGFEYNGVLVTMSDLVDDGSDGKKLKDSKVTALEEAGLSSSEIAAVPFQVGFTGAILLLMDFKITISGNTLKVSGKDFTTSKKISESVAISIDADGVVTVVGEFEEDDGIFSDAGKMTYKNKTLKVESEGMTIVFK